jgi:hypothetical protein
MDQTDRKAIQMLICHKMWQDMDPNAECAANYFHTYIPYSMMQHHGLCIIYGVNQRGFNRSHFEWNGFTEAFCVQNWYTFCVH